MRSLYYHQNNREKMAMSPILPVIQPITIGTMLNFNRGNNGHGPKTLNPMTVITTVKKGVLRIIMRITERKMVHHPFCPLFTPSQLAQC